MISLAESFNKMATELQSTEMLRHDFINNFSHEFKTPIVSIAGFAKLLRRGGLTEPQLDNAIKFSPDSGIIEITIVRDGQYISVRITNNGEKIPGKALGKIFKKFYQADESHSSQGNGIGLAVVKKVVELHKGTVAVESSDSITAFTVKLPA